MAILDEKTLDFISSSFDQTVRLGVRLGELLNVGDVICLSGELGTGKTALARGISRGWGASHRVTSPSYTLVNQYPRLKDGLILFHVDCYRLESHAEVATVGLEDILDEVAAIMIEWPERIDYLLPEDRLWIDMRHISETRRGLRFKAAGDGPTVLLQKFRQSAFGV
jgi:tRNA threonylcarbamoyladenosine biosynthesis protein TsaE